MENWVDIKGFEKLYKISDEGRVFSYKREIILKQTRTKKGYKRIGLLGKSFLIHRLVAQAFIPNPENKPEINHKDTNKLNNHSSNLEWVTSKEHHVISKENKQFSKIKGIEHSNSLLNDKKVLEIRTLYKTAKYTYLNLGKLFNVSKSTIKDIICGKTWKHVDGLIIKDNTRRNEIHPKSKLNSFDVLEIRTMYNERDMSIRKIAKIYNVSKETIRKIVQKLTWTNL
jgi:DNA-binding XRE family transcriptional regulator